MTDKEALRFYLMHRDNVRCRQERLNETWVASVTHVCDGQTALYRRGQSVYNQTVKLMETIKSTPSSKIVKEDPQLRLF